MEGPFLQWFAELELFSSLPSLKCCYLLCWLVNRSVDELYDMCEEEEDEQRCKDAIDIMVSFLFLLLNNDPRIILSLIQERSSRDFRKLIERIEEQKRFDASKGPLSGGISWEVRKPTNTPPKSATVIIQLDQVKIIVKVVIMRRFLCALPFKLL